MIKICFLADGQSIHTKRWCAYFVGGGYDVHLITFRNVEIPGVSVHFIDCGPIQVTGNNKRFLLKIPALRKLIRQINPDIVHAHYATSYGLAGALCGKRPLVVTALGSDVLISPFQSRLYKMLLRYVFRKADHITAMSDPMREIMLGLGAGAEKTSTVIFGIDPQIFNTKGRPNEEGPFTLISTRNFEPVYNIDVLIKAIGLIHTRIPDLKMHLIGAGSMEQQLRALIAELGLSGVIDFHGRMTQPEIADLLRHSQLFISVSSSDGNNISLNEAMACGCFSVVSDIPANHQWVRDGVNGYFAKAIGEHEIAEAILKAFEDYASKKAESLAFNETMIREKGLWSENMKKVEYLYHKLLSHEK